MDNRELVEQSVMNNLGVSFTELKEITGLVNGVVQYHIRRSDRIEKKRGVILEKGACSGCGLRDICTRKCLIGELRDLRKRRILEMKHEGFSQKEIASDLGIDESTVSYHVNRMRDMDLLEGETLVEEVREHIRV